MILIMSCPRASSPSVERSGDANQKGTSDKNNFLASTNQESEISLKSFGDYKLSRSQLRRLTDLLEATDDEKQLNSDKSKEDNKPTKEEIDVNMGDSLCESNSIGSLDTIPEIKKEDNCPSNGKAALLEKSPCNEKMTMGHKKCAMGNQQPQNSKMVRNSSDGKTMLRSSAARIIPGSDKEAIVAVVEEAEKGNISKKKVVAKSPSETISDDLTSSSNWRSSGTAEKEEKDGGLSSSSDITCQQFQCILCEGGNTFIPLDQILVHRWEHYKAVMTFDEYLKGLDNYPPEFQKPQLVIAKNIFSPSRDISPETMPAQSQPSTTQAVYNEGDFSPEKSHSLENFIADTADIESAPSYAVEVTVTTDQQGLDDSE